MIEAHRSPQIEAPEELGTVKTFIKVSHYLLGCVHHLKQWDICFLLGVILPHGLFVSFSDDPTFLADRRTHGFGQVVSMHHFVGLLMGRGCVVASFGQAQLHYVLGTVRSVPGHIIDQAHVVDSALKNKILLFTFGAHIRPIDP